MTTTIFISNGACTIKIPPMIKRNKIPKTVTIPRTKIAVTRNITETYLPHYFNEINNTRVFINLLKMF